MTNNASIVALTLLAAAIAGACASPPPPAGLEGMRPPPGVLVQQGVDSYPVTGTNRAEMARQMREGITEPGGRGFSGLHQYSLRWRYETRADRSNCSVARAFVTLTSTVTLPTWSAPAEADSALIKEWERFRTALAVHERGHRERAYAAAGSVHRAIQNSSEATCSLLSTTVRRVADSLMSVGRRANEAYDAETRHGFTQGAVFRVTTAR